MVQFCISFLGGPVDGRYEELEEPPASFVFTSELSSLSHLYEYDMGASTKDKYHLTARYAGITVREK
jgi:hypothetical protein